MTAAAPVALAGLRRAIDLVDGGSLALLALRGRLASAAGRCKQAVGRPMHDRARELRVHGRAQRIAGHLGLPGDTARAAIALAVADARRRQGLPADLDQGAAAPAAGTMAAMPISLSSAPPVRPLLRRLPPPARLAPLLRAVPAAARHHVIERACRQVLAASMARGDLDFMQGRRLGVEVTDLGLRWVVERDSDRLRVDGGTAEASVRGTATDLLLLAARLEDADTLFFQRRLVLTGDVELGLTVRNLLDRLPWESVPLAVRIGLNRGARLARAARDAHRAGGDAPARGYDRG
ncbi:ubiquinone anaerobic biosynthesis accessory factor UbiT [Novilysobacter arseniciresistens]|uniref:ubiquinone anaerobic biosynthesis accessory factor UbiT n=1 Tax=Novilysobacter arseniciresistens TaxID=1385522 RepID=UPI00068E3FD2|nr:SCP2 sterol-binding domain-containing protein [Lysobacter arseniciresistens]